MERKEALQKLKFDQTISETEKKEQIINIHKRYFQKWDEYLDKVIAGPDYLKEEKIAKVVLDRLREFDGSLYRLIAAAIMPNHIHFLIDTYLQIENLPKGVLPDEDNYVSLAKTMQLIKGGSSFTANKILGRKGKFWNIESYDHLVRHEVEYFNIVRYILMNAVKARLARRWWEWPYTYCMEELIERFRTSNCGTEH